jgi:hypothetical protein
VGDEEDCLPFSIREWSSRVILGIGTTGEHGGGGSIAEVYPFEARKRLSSSFRAGDDSCAVRRRQRRGENADARVPHTSESPGRSSKMTNVGYWVKVLEMMGLTSHYTASCRNWLNYWLANGPARSLKEKFSVRHGAQKKGC